jgi:hypothetical protein
VSFPTGSAEPLGGIRSDEPLDAVFSPDGRWFAYRVRDGDPTGGRSGVFVQPFPITGARYQAPRIIADFHPAWTGDGSALVYVPTAASRQIATVRVNTQQGVTFEAPRLMPALSTGLFQSGVQRPFDILPDGSIVGPTAAATAEAGQFRIVTNWFEELKRLVPTK